MNTPTPNLIAPDVSADLERSDWTPEEALRFYAAGRHYDTVPNGDGTRSARILDNGAIASNALKSMSPAYAAHKGDVALETQAAPKGYIKASEAIDVRTLHAQLHDIWCELNAVDTVLGDQHRLMSKVEKLRDACGSATNCMIPLDASKAQAASPGWKPVPVEPTEAMRVAGFESEAWCQLGSAALAKMGWPYSCKQSSECVAEIFKAMLAAAPKPGDGT